MRLPLASSYLAAVALWSVVGVGALGCDAGRGDSSVETRTSALDVDLTGPIGQRWQELGGAAVMGDATSAVQAAFDGAAQYQTFANGVIVYSVDFGAIRLSQVIFDKWLSGTYLEGLIEYPLFQALGVPIADVSAFGVLQAVKFEGGNILFDGTEARAVHGIIFQAFNDVAVGPPLTESQPFLGGGASQQFQLATVFYGPDTDAFAVSGPILDRYLAAGGPEGSLGFPISNADTLVATDGTTVIGKSARFQNGAIFWSAATGAWEVMGNVLGRYDEKGGPAGWLGFPISASGTTAAGDTFNDFQHGVLVDRLGLVYSFGELEFFLQSIEGSETDCTFGICGAVDIYAFLDLNMGIIRISERLPSSGDYGTDFKTLNLSYPLGTANSALRLNARIEVRDKDDGDDDHLGTMVEDYSIDNLWGAAISDVHHDHTAARPSRSKPRTSSTPTTSAGSSGGRSATSPPRS